jgi:hypothetical protein
MRAPNTRTCQSMGALLLTTIVCFGASTPTRAQERGEEPLRYEVIVVGATPGGVAAAVAAARAGRSVAVFEPSAHVGGVVSGGLTATDYGDKRTIGGLSREFFDHILQHYRDEYGPDSAQVKACNQGYWFEPHVAERVFREWLESAGKVELFLEHTLLTVEREGDRVSRLEFRDEQAGSQRWVVGDMFVDALYEGDLMALAEVPYRVGREGSHEFDEPHAGVRPGEPEPEGTADLRVQAYNYRLCLTDNPDNRVAIPQPEGYRREDYVTVEAFLKASPQATFAKQVVSMVPMPNAKTDTNNGVAWQSTDYPGANHAYPGQTCTRRKEIADDHRRYILGLLYFMQNDPGVPDAVREEARQWGLAADEFADSACWPHQLYVRVSRRMVGTHVFTEHDAAADPFKDDSIGLGSYAMDSHAVRVLPQPDGTLRKVGELWIAVDPYEIPYGVLVPQQVRNLLVAVSVSATHVGYCTLRMEPVYMIMGHACGEAAAMALETGRAVQDLDVAELQQRLLAAGQIIRANRRPAADFRVQTPLPVQAGTPVQFEDASTDEDGRIVEWHWDLDGDGVIDSHDPNPSSSFTLSQAYQVKLMVRDDYGKLSAPARHAVEVIGGPPGTPDIVIDNDEAEVTGNWWPSSSSPGFVGVDYLHDGDRNKGELAVRYVPAVEKPGLYEVALSYTAHANRASNVPVRIRHADGEVVTEVNQQEAPEAPPFHTIGRYPFAPEAPAAIEIGNAGTAGFVIADGVRLRYAGPLPAT